MALTYRGWLAKEIADHMEMLERTIKRRIASINDKLSISDRNILEKFMIRQEQKTRGISYPFDQTHAFLVFCAVWELFIPLRIPCAWDFPMV